MLSGAFGTQCAGVQRPPQRSFFPAVYELVRRVPHGRVTTYGAVARALGMPNAARQVGWALAALSDNDSLVVPAHRIVSAGGVLSPGFAHGVPGVQRDMLADEGVCFDRAGRVCLARHFWEP